MNRIIMYPEPFTGISHLTVKPLTIETSEQLDFLHFTKLFGLDKALRVMSLLYLEGYAGDSAAGVFAREYQTVFISPFREIRRIYTEIEILLATQVPLIEGDLDRLIHAADRPFQTLATPPVNQLELVPISQLPGRQITQIIGILHEA